MSTRRSQRPTKRRTTDASRSRAVSTPRIVPQQVDAPIDVDAIDDDVVFLSASTGIPQIPNQSSGRTAPVLVVLDEESDAQEVPSGAATEDPITISCQRYVRRNRDIIIRDDYDPSKNNTNAERHTRSGSSKHKIVAPIPPKEPTFSCAVCLGQLVDETTTNCGHIFCEECIKAAIKTQKKCPTCRRPLTVKKIHRIYLPTSTQ